MLSPLTAFLLGILATAVVAGIFIAGMRKRMRGEHRDKMDKQSDAHELQTRQLRDDIAAIREQLEAERKAIQQDKAHLNEELERVSRDRKEAIKRREQADNLAQEYAEKIKKAVNIDPSVALEQLREGVRKDAADELRDYKFQLINQGEEEIEQEAQRILVDVMQRISTQPNNDVSATIVQLPNDEMKGRIIGREGRNIKTFEQCTGVTLMIDETPDSVLVSSFDPIRREVARIALESLMKDGRIHPANIEEHVDRAKEETERSLTEYGEDVLRRLRLNRVSPEIVRLLGRLRFRLSNNQNSLDHSMEVASMCGLLAAELKLETEPAVRAGLFHDIGKVMGEEYEGSHAIVGAELLQRLNEDPRVVNAVAAHHQEVPAESPYAAIVMMADSISAMRPGARSGTVEGFIKRVHQLESIALSYEGVEEAFALQAGREIRIVVRPDRVCDNEAKRLARLIRNRIEEEMHYPGTIRITIIREARFSEVAK